MRNALIAIVVILLGTGSPLPVSAQPPAPPASQTSQASKVDSGSDAKTQALQAEVQVLREFTQHILATVYFALGAVVVVLVAMSGFGWYQNARIYARDKEALTQWLTVHLADQLAARTAQLEDQAKARFLAFDHKMAEALRHSEQRMLDLHMHFEASIFSTTHSEPTPQTDFHVFLNVIRANRAKVSSGVLDHALTTVTEHIESLPRIDSLLRTQLLALANELTQEHAAHAERIREVLGRKPQ